MNGWMNERKEYTNEGRKIGRNEKKQRKKEGSSLYYIKILR